MDIGGPYLKSIDLKMLSQKHIIIYGAGTYGVFLHSYLDIKGMKDNVLYFAVSEEKGNRKAILGKPVLPFREICADMDENVIIAAVGPKGINSVVENIRRKSECSYYCFSQNQAALAAQEIFMLYQKLPLQKNKIFFYCYEGMGYRCNCKYIAEKLLEDGDRFELIWAVSDIEDARHIPGDIKTVTIGTKEYYQELYTSSVMVENDGKDLFAYKRKGQFCINTWHGYGPFKKVNGALKEKDGKKMREYYSYYDLFLTASRFYSQVYRDSFGYEGEIYECGAPRNDLLFQSGNAKEKIHQLYGIPMDKGIVFLAPTFRQNKTGSFDMYDVDMVQVLSVIKEKFRKDHVLMYRFHHQLYKLEKRNNFYPDGIDATLYPDVQELLAAADIVITDYSSLMWDFSLQRKPVFLYQKDLEEYGDRRGFYAPVSEWPYPQAHTQEELEKAIRDFDNEQYIQELDSFLDKYGSCDDGHAAERVVKRITGIIRGDKG